MVPDGQHQRVGQCPGAHLDGFGAVFGGVLQQIDQNPLHQLRVELDQWKIARNFGVDSQSIQRRLRRPNRRTHNLFYRLPLQAQLNCAVL